MMNLSKKLIVGFLILAISQGVQAGEIILKGERSPLDGFVFSREEIDKFQILKEERELLEKRYEKRMDQLLKPKSPLKAALFSLAVPGTGQIFYGERIVKGGIMLGIEGGLITGIVLYSNLSSKKMEDYTATRSVSDFNAGVEYQQTRNLFITGTVLLGLYSAIDSWITVKNYNKEIEKIKSGKEISFYSDGESSGVKLSLNF